MERLKPQTLELLRRELEKAASDVDTMVGLLSLSETKSKAVVVLESMTPLEQQYVLRSLETFEHVGNALDRLAGCAMRRDVLNVLEVVNNARASVWSLNGPPATSSFVSVQSALLDNVCVLGAANYANLRACDRGHLLMLWFDSSEYGEAPVYLCRECALDEDVLRFWMKHVEASYVPQTPYDPIPGFYFVVEPTLYDSEPSPVFMDASILARPAEIVSLVRHHEKTRDRFGLR
jgi:hypothetical protein